MVISANSCIHTNRLILRMIDEHDASFIYKLRSDEMVNKHLERKRALDQNEAVQFINMIKDAVKDGKSFYWIICLKEGNLPVGTICLWNFSTDHRKAEIGYELLTDFQKKGYMNESIKTIIKYAFQSLQIKALEAVVKEENIASINLLEKNGFMRYSNEPEGNITFMLEENDSQG